ncbi:DUF1638 domain-containing protein [Candidatus Poribacteria bacterium]
MRLKVIACEVLFREICLCAAQTRNIISIEFLERGLHDNPDLLRSEVQRKIDETDGSSYDGILLGYALCSNGVMGIQARGIPLVIPRAHDCVTLFLGSKENYSKHFNDNPGTYYYTSGWLERAGSKVERKVQDGRGMGAKYEEYVEKYGEDNARYLMEFEKSWIENYSYATYIDLEFVRFLNYKEQAEKVAAERGWKYEELPGDMRLIRKLIDGEWAEDEFLTVPPGEQIIASYDSHVMGCKPV